MVTPTFPAAEQLWQQILDHCQIITNKRAEEDQAKRAIQEEEHQVILAIEDSDKRGKKLYDCYYRNMDAQKLTDDIRTAEDAVLIRSIFDASLDLGFRLNLQIATPPITATSSAEVSSSPLRKGGRPSLATVNAVVKTEAPYTNKRSSKDKKLTTQGRMKSTIKLAEVDVSAFVLEYPKGSKIFYVLKCILCGREMESAQSMYAHITQADAQHLALFAGEKSFKKAVQVCGTVVLDGDWEMVRIHNNARLDAIKPKQSKRGS